MERGKKRSYFAQAAAAIGRGLVENAELGLLLGNGLRGQDVVQVQMPLGGDAVAVFIGSLEVIAGIEEEDGDVGRYFPDQMQTQQRPPPENCW